MDECCELQNYFHDEEVVHHGKENNNLELRLGPPVESQHDRRFTGDTEQFYGCSQNQKRTRTSNASAVGWPPIASFRKNITNSCSRRQQATEPEKLSQKEGSNKDNASPAVHTFVKVYMDSYPIGRKIDLRTYDGYEKLSFAINVLFQGLLAGEASFTEHDAHVPKDEYTLVYEDNEGDRILVGDVPWNMFVTTAKKLHVLKSSHTENGR